MKAKRWTYFGHVMRLLDDKLPREILKWRPVGRRRRGRPNQTRRRIMERERFDTGINMEDAERVDQIWG